jgi:pimeloyl-ACP methyl ester carboxylesterase
MSTPSSRALGDEPGATLAGAAGGIVSAATRRTEVLVDGVRTSVLVAGSQEDDVAVVFVHGSSGMGRDWTPLLETVSEFARCIAPDMPGYGASDKPADFPYTVGGYARHLDGRLGMFGVRRAHLVTHDLGGPWGLAWAASRPADLVSLTFMSIGVLPGYRWHRIARLYRLPVIGELVLAAAGRLAIARVLQRGSQRPVPEWFVDEISSEYRDPGTRRAVLAFYRATPDLGAATVASAAALRGADPPTLVIWGAGDPYVPVRFAEVQRHFFPRAEVVVLPHCGHWPLVDDPGAVTGAVVGFLKAQTSARTGAGEDRGMGSA